MKVESLEPSPPNLLEFELDVPPRRGVLGLVSRAGVAAVAAAAGILATAAPASASHCPSGLYHCGCCCLAKPNSNSTWSPCGSGYTLRYWECCQNGFIYRCDECTKGSTCYQGPWQKSRCYIRYQCGCC
jgi:hypothetical protein